MEPGRQQREPQAHPGALPAAGKERPVCAQPAQRELEDEVDQKTIWLSPHLLN